MTSIDDLCLEILTVIMDFSKIIESEHAPYSASPTQVTNLVMANDSLFDLILKFNLFPALYVHPSWVHSLNFLQDADPFDPKANPYWVRYLSTTLLNMYHLDQLWEFDFSNPVKRLALIDADDLINFGCCVAAILVQPYLKKIISGDKIAVINRVIGAENREFSLRWKPASNNSSVLSSKQVLPEIASLKVLTELAYNAMTTREDWERFVIRLTSSLLPQDASALRSRMVFKFPIDCRDVDYFHLTEDKRALVAALFFEVIKQRSPEWQGRLELTSPGETTCNA